MRKHLGMASAMAGRTAREHARSTALQMLKQSIRATSLASSEDSKNRGQDARMRACLCDTNASSCTCFMQLRRVARADPLTPQLCTVCRRPCRQRMRLEGVCAWCQRFIDAKRAGLARHRFGVFIGVDASKRRQQHADKSSLKP
mmetsp:Transcript_22782/g.60649  ORF Transcript_22782/g.60649 Transcript_22782/m.60649 type:complete len:144 (+) Transcript_22782:299-730(+)